MYSSLILQIDKILLRISIYAPILREVSDDQVHMQVWWLFRLKEKLTERYGFSGLYTYILVPSVCAFLIRSRGPPRDELIIYCVITGVPH